MMTTQQLTTTVLPTAVVLFFIWFYGVGPWLYIVGIPATCFLAWLMWRAPKRR